MPTREFTLQLIQKKFQFLAKTCENEYLTDTEKLWMIKYISEIMAKWVQDEHKRITEGPMLTEDLKPKTPPSQQ